MDRLRYSKAKKRQSSSFQQFGPKVGRWASSTIHKWVFIVILKMSSSIQFLMIYTNIISFFLAIQCYDNTSQGAVDRSRWPWAFGSSERLEHIHRIFDERRCSFDLVFGNKQNTIYRHTFRDLIKKKFFYSLIRSYRQKFAVTSHSTETSHSILIMAIISRFRK